MQFNELDIYCAIYGCFLAALMGLVMGSFLNCSAIRIVNGEPIARGRSHCMSCKHVLGARDLVPLFSWLALKGRCRYCGERIPARYPITELVAAIAYVSIFIRYGITAECCELLILVSLLLVISFCDIEAYLIPDRFIVAGILVRCAYIIYAWRMLGADIKSMTITSLIGGFSIALPILVLSIIMDRILGKDSMGGGDIKLLFMTGLYLPWYINLLGILLACVCGIIIGLFIRKRNEEGMIPFGPFIAAGVWICLLCGQEIIDAYLGLFMG